MLAPAVLACAIIIGLRHVLRFAPRGTLVVHRRISHAIRVAGLRRWSLWPLRRATPTVAAAIQVCPLACRAQPASDAFSGCASVIVCVPSYLCTQLSVYQLSVDQYFICQERMHESWIPSSLHELLKSACTIARSTGVSSRACMLDKLLVCRPTPCSRVESQR